MIILIFVLSGVVARIANSPEICVCVPVRDERQLLPQLMDALMQQTYSGVLTICLYFDGCTDGAYAWAKMLRPSSCAEILLQQGKRSRMPNAGYARRAAVAMALRHFSSEPAVILSTDADSVPTADWVSKAWLSLQSADLVAGHIVRERTANCEGRDRLETYLERLHMLRRWLDPIAYDNGPSHPHTGGANLAIHAQIYRHLGGFHAMASGEDRDLVHRARLAGYRVRQDRNVNVTTSGRTAGRAQGGLADDLKANFDADTFMVEHPDDAMRYYSLQALARQAYDATHRVRHLRDLAEQLQCNKSCLNELILSSPSADAFVTRAVPSPPMRTVSLRIAEPMLSRQLELRKQTA